MLGDETITATPTQARNIDGLGCEILKPDGFSGTVKESYTSGEWAEAEKEGLVALPLAGARTATYLGDFGYAVGYFTSTPYADSIDKAWIAGFDYDVGGVGYNKREFCYSVRLVQVVDEGN